jgi:threonine/homoserine/homoserine lactone efflux protein
MQSFNNDSCHSAEGTSMSEFTNNRFIILLAAVFPIMLLAAAVYLQSSICIIISIFIWIGVVVTMLYIPHNRNGRNS